MAHKNENDSCNHGIGFHTYMMPGFNDPAHWVPYGLAYPYCTACKGWCNLKDKKREA